MNAFYEQRKERLFIGEMTRYPFPTHVHDLAELIIPTAGTVTLGIDAEKYRLEAGDAAVAFPLVPHSYEELSPDARGLVAIFRRTSYRNTREPFTVCSRRCPCCGRNRSTRR